MQENYEIALVIIICFGFTCRVHVSLDKNLHAWDERFHALVAKNLVENPIKPLLYKNPKKNYDFKDWSENHIWLHKFPVPLWLMSFSINVFGNSAFACRITSIILSTLSIYVVYLVSLQLFGSKKIAIYSSFLLAINGLIIELSGGRVATDHIDIAFFSFILIAIYFTFKLIESSRKVHLLLVSLFLALAILSKWLPALIVLPLLVLYGLKNKVALSKISIYVWWIIFFTGSLVAPWLIYTYKTYPEIFLHEMNNNRLHITQSLTDHHSSWVFYLNFIRINYGELVYLPLIALAYYFFKSKKMELLLLLVWIGVPIIFFSFAKTRMQGYILLVAPAIFIATSYYVEQILKKKTQKKIWQLIALLMFALPIRYSLERIKPFKAEEQFILEEYNIDSKTNYEKTIFYNCVDPIQIMFFTNCHAAYKNELEKSEILGLEKKGFKVMNVNNRGDQ